VIDWSQDETDDPNYADQRNFYKVERWTKDGPHITDLLYAGNSLERAREILTAAKMFRPGRPYTIRQGIRVLANWRGLQRSNSTDFRHGSLALI
jgi:hypothetical protein